jgi:hypothetical protein
MTKIYKVSDLKINQGGLMRCCIQTILEILDEFQPDTEFQNNTIYNCRYELPDNETIILIDGVFQYNQKE